MDGRRGGYPFDANFNWDRDNLFGSGITEGGSPPFPPVAGEFLLLDSTNFLLLDGTNLLLL